LRKFLPGGKEENRLRREDTGKREPERLGMGSVIRKGGGLKKWGVRADHLRRRGRVGALQEKVTLNRLALATCDKTSPGQGKKKGNRNDAR